MPDPARERRKITTPDGATLVAESIGDPGRPTLLLLGGMNWSMDWWEDDLCAQLAGLGVRVVRFDQRDTGESTSYEPGDPGYGPAELAGDALAVLDGFGVGQAHLLGLSMGGGMAQALAAEHPQRCRTLTLMSTSPAADTGDALPPPDAAIMATFSQAPEPPDWSDREAVIAWCLEGERPFAGPDRFDEAAVREVLGRIYDRTTRMESSMTNHAIALTKGGDPVDLSAIRAPALVVHGTHDPLFSIEHGRAMARVLSAGEVVELAGVGHQAPPRDTWPKIITALRRHLGVETTT